MWEVMAVVIVGAVMVLVVVMSLWSCCGSL